MMKVSAFLLATFSCTSFADTYLCIAEAGAAVEHGGSDGIKAGVADMSKSKFLQTNESGKWVVKMLGKDSALFNKCTSPYFCEHADGYAGAFMRKEDGIFGVTWITVEGTRELIVVAKGRCSKL